MLSTGNENAAIENVSIPVSDATLRGKARVGQYAHKESPMACEATTSSAIASAIAHTLPWSGK